MGIEGMTEKECSGHVLFNLFIQAAEKRYPEGATTRALVEMALLLLAFIRDAKNLPDEEVVHVIQCELPRVPRRRVARPS